MPDGFRRHLRRTTTRLTLATVIAFLVGAALAASLVLAGAASVGLHGVDADLHRQADRVEASFHAGAGPPVRGETSRSQSLPEDTADGYPVDAAVVFDGRVRVSTPGLRDSGQVAGWAGPTTGESTRTVDRGGTQTRVLTRAVTGPTGEQGTLILLRSLDDLRSTVARTGVALGVSVLLLAVLTAVLSNRLARHALRPATAMARAAAAISEDDLSQRITSHAPDDELGELAAALNGLLGRLEGSITSQRQLTANASHELRTPLAQLRAEIEVTLGRERTGGEYRSSLATLLGEVERLSSLTDRLLLLARADAGALVPAHAPMDLGDTVEEAYDRWRTLAEREGVTLVREVEAAVPLCGDPVLLRQVVDNLVSNAVRHGRRPGQVVVTATAADGNAVLRVADDGTGFPSGIDEELFRPFVRGAAPARGHAGAGLGLALCRAVVLAHGGTLGIDHAAAGATVVVTIPQQRPPGPG